MLMTLMIFVRPAASADGNDAGTQATVRFDLPAQPLDAALVAFGEVTGYSVLVSRQLAAGRVAASVRGGYTPTEALQRLLVGTQLGARLSGSNAFTLLALAEAKAGGWAAPNEIPAWTKRIRVEGDVRARYEARYYDMANSNIEIDWRSLNSGSGYDVNSNTNLALPALLNTRQDRKHLLRARARLSILADISDSTQAGSRLASGNDDSPVSTTQTLGGGLGKKNIWLDQAWLSYQPAAWLKLTALG